MQEFAEKKGWAAAEAAAPVSGQRSLDEEKNRGWLRFPSFSFPRKKEAVAGATASFHFKLVGLCGFEP